jgi:hypothetical protein
VLRSGAQYSADFIVTDARHTPNDTPTPHIRHTFMIPIDIF